MQCPSQSKETSEVLLDYCSRKLNPEATLLLERHMLDCAQCRDFVTAQQTVWNALDCWEEVPVSPDFNRKLYAKIDEHERSSWWQRTWNRLWESQPGAVFGWRPVMPIATACVTLAAALMLYAPSPKPQPEHGTRSTPQVTNQSVDLDQVETTLEDMEMLRQLSAPSGNAGSAKM